jgi:hypothetical protein
LYEKNEFHENGSLSTEKRNAENIIVKIKEREEKIPFLQPHRLHI